jgi:hypothetical protein
MGKHLFTLRYCPSCERQTKHGLDSDTCRSCAARAGGRVGGTRRRGVPHTAEAKAKIKASLAGRNTRAAA